MPIIFVLLIAVKCHANPILADDAANSNWTQTTAFVQSLFQNINKRIDSLESIQYQATRVTKSQNITLEEHWSFLSASEGRLRIEYSYPEPRIFVSDGKVFTEYIPRARAAMQSSLEKQDSEILGQISAVLLRFSIEGLRVGNSDKLLQHMEAVEEDSTTPSILRIRGSNPRYEIEIDTNRKIILKFTKKNQLDQTTLSIMTGDFLQLAPDLWFPTKIQTAVLEDAGVRETITHLSNIKINAPLNDKRFDLFLAPDVKVTSR